MKSLISDDRIRLLEYDKYWSQIDKDLFKSFEQSLYDYSIIRKNINDSIDSGFNFDYCWAEWINCKGDSYQFSVLRIVEVSSVDDIFCFFICPAFKIDYDMAKTKRVPLVKNKLNLVPGKVDDLSDINSNQTLNYNNSYYDKKLKKRVPILVEVKVEKKETKKESITVKQKVENELINNTDIKVEGQLHSSDFLNPELSKRIWVLLRGKDVGWAWYIKEVDGVKNKYEYYCRPNIIDDSTRQYDRGGSMFTNAYLKKDFPNLMNEALDYQNLLSIKRELCNNKNNPIELNCIIDAFLIKI